MHSHRTFRNWWIALLVAACCAPVAAQAPPQDAPVAVGAPVLETNPAVRAVLEIPRDGPADYVKALNWLIDLGRPELAKPILDELTKLQLTDAQRAALVEQFGSRTMLQIARTKELAPAGAEFADACMAAAAAAANDPQRIAALVAQLADPSAEVRTIARNDLAATGPTGVAATLESLAKENNPDRRAAMVTAAAQMDPLVVRPLLAMLDTNDPALRADVAALLRQLDVPQAVPLLRQRSDSAERALNAAIENLRERTPPFPSDESNRIELWHWDDATKKLTSAQYPADEARVIWMARLARELAQLRPENRAYLRQALLLELEADALVPATHRAPANEQITAADTRLVNDVLADALGSNYAHAAVTAADALGQRGDASVLYTAGAEPSPLANALVHSSRRVRFAALRAIMTLDPASPYPGSSRVPEALAWFAGGSGERRALVAMPTIAAATNLAGMLAAHDLEVDATNRGRDAVAMAREMPDLEAILVDMNIQSPGIRQVLYELRISPTTGATPIGLLAAEGRLQAAERLAAEHHRVIAVPRPHSAEVLARVVEQLTNEAGRDVVSPDKRAAQAKEAQAWLVKLSSGHRPFYTIRRTALFDRIESRQDAQTPASLPTP